MRPRGSISNASAHQQGRMNRLVAALQASAEWPATCGGAMGCDGCDCVRPCRRFDSSLRQRCSSALVMQDRPLRVERPGVDVAAVEPGGVAYLECPGAHSRPPDDRFRVKVLSRLSAPPPWRFHTPSVAEVPQISTQVRMGFPCRACFRAARVPRIRVLISGVRVRSTQAGGIHSGSLSGLIRQVQPRPAKLWW
jgi:hypothetical protein